MRTTAQDGATNVAPTASVAVENSQPTLSRGTVGRLMGETPAERTGEDSAAQDATFQGTIRKHGTSGLTNVEHEGSGIKGAWYRPCDAAMADKVRKYAPGDSVIVRVSGDAIVGISAHEIAAPQPVKTSKRAVPRTAPVTTATSIDPRRGNDPESKAFRAANAQHAEQQAASARRRGDRLRETSQEESENALARLRGLSSTSVLRSANEALDDDLESKHAASLEALKVKPGGMASGVAFNAKLAGFVVDHAVSAADARIGKRPNRYKFHNGMLYLSRV